MNPIRNSWGMTLKVLVAYAVVAAVGVAAASAQEAPDENRWPVQLDTEYGQVIIYQPQYESYQNNILEARSAVSITPKGQTDAVFGAIWFEARLSTDLDTHMALCDDLKVTAAKFPTAEDQKVEEFSRFLEREVPQWEIVVSVDHLVASMEAVEARKQDAGGMNTDPPEIIYVTYPAVLVLIDGDPTLADMEGYDLKYVVNTPYFIAQDPTSKKFYLKGGDYWYIATDLTGEWQTTKELPKEIREVAKAIEEEEKKQAAEQAEGADSLETAAAPAEADAAPPKIIVRTGPAELIVSDGELKFAPIEGTELLYVENTETDIVMDLASQQYYILLSGRWYKSKSPKEGKWTFVSPDEVPAEFANIPAESDMGQVRASVAGTEEAKEAVLENQIPQTAEVDRKTATVEVKYDGDPQFEKCDDNVAYALNTDKSVLLIDGTYYCCDQAVWFVSRGPEGPWQVATEVPEAVQGIPPECPVYNVKYVYIYDSTPEVVYIGYTPGYTSSYVYYGTVVYGTGYWYRPWYHHYYYPRPVTWGFRAHWNPYTGWGFSFGMSVGWLHIGIGRPWYGGWWGPGGYRHGYRHGYHRGYRHGYHQGARAGYRAGYRAGQRSSHANMYKSRNTGVRHTGAAKTPKMQTARHGATTQKKTPKATNKKNNVYSDKNGNAYRKQGNDWQKKDKSGWSSSKGSNQNLNRDQSSRQRSQQKSTQRQSSRSRGGGGGRRR